MIGIGKNLIQQLADLSKTNTPTDEDITSGLGGAIETDIDSGIIHCSIKNLVWVFSTLTLEKDLAMLWKDITEAATTQLQEIQQLDYRKMNAVTFIKTFGVVRPAAVMRLLGTLLVKLYAEPTQEEDESDDDEDKTTKKKATGSRARKVLREKRKKAKRKAQDVEDEDEAEAKQQVEEAKSDVAVAQDPIMKQIIPLIGFLHACCYVPAQGSPLAVACKEVLDIMKHSLKSEKFVRLFAKFSSDWKNVNIKKNKSQSFKSSSKGKLVISAAEAKPKERKMMTTTDGATVQSGTTKRKRGTGPINKKSSLKRRK